MFSIILMKMNTERIENRKIINLNEDKVIEFERFKYLGSILQKVIGFEDNMKYRTMYEWING